MADVHPEYILGYSERELERLAVQARLFAPLTERFLREAGLRPGMKVLDVGAGHGEVSFLAARLVGPEGSVVALEQAASSVAAIQRQIEALGLPHVRAVQGDLFQARFDTPFDAVIGRLVLLHVPDATAALRHLATHLRPGGLIAFQDMDFSAARSQPTSPTYERALGWLSRTLAKAGGHGRMGLELRRCFLEAGLPDPSLLTESSLGGARDFLGYALVADSLQSMMPMMEKLGVVSAHEAELATLPQRLYEEVGARGGVLVAPALVGAWSTLPS